MPLINFGKFPHKALFHTSWRKGARLVTADGTPVKLGDLAIGGLLTVFPATQNPQRQLGPAHRQPGGGRQHDAAHPRPSR